MATMYGIKNCDTIKKARTWLDEHDVEYTFHDYKKSGIDSATLKKWARQVGWETLLNRRGTTWRKLPEGTREKIDQASAIRLMQEQPSMIKRPVLVYNEKLTVGFNAEDYARALLPTQNRLGEKT